MNLENHGEMFLEPSARMDIPSSDGRLLQTDRLTRWNQYTPFSTSLKGVGMGIISNFQTHIKGKYLEHFL